MIHTPNIIIASSLRVRGRFQALLIDAQTGRVDQEVSTPNLVTKIGRKGGRDGTWPNLTHKALGTGSTAPASGDTALVTEVYRDVFTSSDLTQDVKAIYRLVLSASEGNGNTFTEAGLFDAASAGNLFARVTFDGLAKTDQKILQTTWTVFFENG